MKSYEAIIKGENIPEAGIPESFKVLLKELQALGLDVRVLREDNMEVELAETSDYGGVDIRSILEADGRRFNRDDESFGNHGISKQESEVEDRIGVSPEEDDDLDEAEPADTDDNIAFEE